MSTAALSPTITRVGPRRPAAATPARQSELRLTTRGRVVVFSLALVALLAAAVWLGAGSVATERPEQTRVITVAPGDSLWAIASDVAVDGDVRGTMAAITELNDLTSGSLQAGQRLRVPTRD